MNKSEQINELASALAKAQAGIKKPEKNKTVTVRTKAGGTYTFDYADLGAITDAIRHPLATNGLSYAHLIDRDEKATWLVTVLMHSSGQFLTTRYPLPANPDPKEFGGAITYGKRYSLSALTGCVADDDADADPANTTEFKDRKPKQPESKMEKGMVPPGNGNQKAGYIVPGTVKDPRLVGKVIDDCDAHALSDAIDKIETSYEKVKRAIPDGLKEFILYARPVILKADGMIEEEEVAT